MYDSVTLAIGRRGAWLSIRYAPAIQHGRSFLRALKTFRQQASHHLRISSLGSGVALTFAHHVARDLVHAPRRMLQFVQKPTVDVTV